MSEAVTTLEQSKPETPKYLGLRALLLALEQAGVKTVTIERQSKSILCEPPAPQFRDDINNLSPFFLARVPDWDIFTIPELRVRMGIIILLEDLPQLVAAPEE